MAIVKPQRWKRSCQRWLSEVTANLQKNHLWRRILKNTICTTAALIIGLIPQVVAVFGTWSFLGAMTTVFGYPGRRFGQMAESLILILLGTALGLGWSFLGLYLSSLAISTNISAAYAIRAVFFAFALILHGLLRSSTPRLFVFAFFFILVSDTVLTTTANVVTASLASSIAYPILTAVGVALVINVAIFPEFSSGFLGKSTIETLTEAVECLENAGNWFMSNSQAPDYQPSEKGPQDDLRIKLGSLTNKKSKLRAQLAANKKAQAECNFELVYAALPPQSLKPISMISMTRLVQNTISLMNAFESKCMLIGEDGNNDEPEQDAIDEESDSSSRGDSSSDSSSTEDSSPKDEASKKRPKHPRKKSKHLRNLELVKPIREIESGDIDLLESILSQVRVPAKALQYEINKALQLIICCLAYCYDVPMPSGARAPSGIMLDEIDIRVNAFTEAMSLYDTDSVQALEHAAAMACGENSVVDIMPRMETFLISSFLVTLRQAGSQLTDILEYSRTLVQRKQDSHEKRSIHLPKIPGSWKKWLTSGGEQDANALPENARKEARTGHGTREEKPDADNGDSVHSGDNLLRHGQDIERGATKEKVPELLPKGKIPRRKGPQKAEVSNSLWLRGLVADAIELLADSDDLAFALKMSIAAFIVTWPAFVPSLNAWYGSVKGSWASLQLVLLFEVSVGTSFMGFFLRLLGVIFGCVLGFLAFQIGQGNRVVAVVVLVLGILPSSYVHLGTPYVKAGIISIVSMSVVALASILTPDEHPYDIFAKRLACFLIGAAVALIVEMTLFPVRARDRLVESLASTIQQISNMEASVAVGIDGPQNIDVKSHALNASFSHAKEKAESALSAARTFIPFTLTEPRLKGSFKGQALIYNEVIFVLFQIIDRMDNMLHMRSAYGSSVLEELNEEVLPYRRNVAASITLTLFAVHEALTTRLPLPQFLPSSRVAQLRYISRVREVLFERVDSRPGSSAATIRPGRRWSTVPLQEPILKSITKQNFLSWNASSAGMMEIIEYLEELVDLAKLLVGVNAFRSGMLERPNFYEYIKKIKNKKRDQTMAEAEQQIQKIKSHNGSSASGSGGARKRRGFSFRRANSMGAAPSKRRPSFLERSTVQQTGDAAADSTDESAVVEDLPMSLQRVMTKRMEDRQQQQRRKRAKSDPKGKGVMRSMNTWGN